jgi:hypothetical protein
MGFDFSRAASSAEETSVEFARFSICALFWGFSFNSMIVNGRSLCVVINNSGMEKDEDGGKVGALFSDV